LFNYFYNFDVNDKEEHSTQDLWEECNWSDFKFKLTSNTLLPILQE